MAGARAALGEGADDKPRGTSGRPSIFISHVEENRDEAEAIARGLQEQGYDAWSYETDTVPGPTYLAQVVHAIEGASAMILIISPESLGSHQVAREIDVAHEMDRPIIPVLKDITHERYLQRRPEWRLALGARTSIAIPAEGVAAIIPRVVRGLEVLGMAPGQPSASLEPAQPARSFRRRLARLKHRPWNLVLLGAALIAVLGLVSVAFVLASGGLKPGVTGQSPSGTSVAPGSVNANQVQATISGVPSTVGAGPFTVQYTITNKSGTNIETSRVQILVEVAPGVRVGPAQPATSAVILADISQDIAAGSTAHGSASIDLSGTPLGPTTIFIDMGTRVAGNATIDDQVLAVAPTTVKA